MKRGTILPKPVALLRTAFVVGMALGPSMAAAESLCAYVVNDFSGHVGVIDAETHTLLASVEIGVEVQTVALDSAGRFLYAVVRGAAEGDARLVVVDTSSYAVVSSIAVPDCSDAVVVASDGLAAYLSDLCEGGIVVVDLVHEEVVGTVRVGTLYSGSDLPTRFALTSDGTRAYVPLPQKITGSIAVVDTESFSVEDVITLRQDLEVPEPISVIVGPGDEAAYVLLHSGGGIVPVIDINGGGGGGEIELTGAAAPAAGAISQDGRTLYVTDARGDLYVIDTESGGSSKVAVGDPSGPAPVTVAEGGVVYLGNRASKSVWVVNAAENVIEARIPVGGQPRDIAIGRVVGPCKPSLYTPLATYTPTPLPTATPTKLFASECLPGQPCLDIGSLTSSPGETATVEVRFTTAGQAIVAFENEIVFDDAALSVRGCKAGEGFASLGGFAYSPGTVRALVFSDGGVPIRDGAVVYTCDVAIGAGAATGNYLLLAIGIVAAAPNGERVAVASSDGNVVVEDRRENTAAGDRASRVLGSSGGCQVSPGHSTSQWFLSFAIAFLCTLIRVRRKQCQVAEGQSKVDE